MIHILVIKIKKYIRLLVSISLFLVLLICGNKMYKHYLKIRYQSTHFKLDSKSIECIRMNLETDMMKPSIAASFGGGRTANQLCEFASGYALWRQFGILNYIDVTQYEKLTKTFDLPVVNGNNNSSTYYIWNEGK